MTPFHPSVWAPDRQRVRLRAEQRDVELTQDDHGWWHGPDPLDPGTDYAYLLDDDDTPLPRYVVPAGRVVGTGNQLVFGPSVPVAATVGPRADRRSVRGRP